MFTDCIALTEIALPASIKKIGFWAFATTNIFVSSNLTTVTIPDSVETIEFPKELFWGRSNAAFEGCSKLSLASQAALKKRGYRDSF